MQYEKFVKSLNLAKLERLIAEANAELNERYLTVSQADDLEFCNLSPVHYPRC